MVQRSIRGIEGMSGDIGKAADAVSQLADEVASVDEVLAVIRSISEQTNLLALNAAIEAARAGEMGRGFAVVADEVRTLARRTQLSTDEVQQMIQRLKLGAGSAVSSMQAGQQATGSGVESSQRTGASLSAITDQVEHISDMNHQVATATEEQSAVTEEINRTVQGFPIWRVRRRRRCKGAARSARRCVGWLMTWRGRWVGSGSRSQGPHGGPGSRSATNDRADIRRQLTHPRFFGIPRAHEARATAADKGIEAPALAPQRLDGVLWHLQEHPVGLHREHQLYPGRSLTSDASSCAQ